MRRIVLFRIGGITVIVVGVMFLLMSITPLPNAADNGFTRNFISEGQLSEGKTYKFVEPLTKIVGVTDDKIYLSGDSPIGLFSIKKVNGKGDSLIIRMNIPPEKMVPFYLEIDSINLFLHLNNLKSVVVGAFPGGAMKICTLKTNVFTKSVQISPEQLVVRTFSSNFKEQVFQKLDARTGEKLLESSIPDLLDGMGGMSTDGLFAFDKKRKLIFYVEAFRNRFYCLDSNLNLVYKQSTIDTVSSNKVGLAMEEMTDSTSKLVPDEARRNVNVNVLIGDEHLFVVSNLRGDNQSHSAFNSVVSIDLYRIEDGKYVGSLAVSKIADKPFKSAKIYRDTLYALFNGKVVTYNLNLKHKL